MIYIKHDTLKAY